MDSLFDIDVVKNELKKLYTFQSILSCDFLLTGQLYSQEGKGLFTLGVVGMHAFPLEAISPRADEIHASVPKSARTPGLTEQRVQQLKRIQELAPEVEIISFPGFLSRPSNINRFKLSTITIILVIQIRPSQIRNMLH
jgi:hypothetical protein